MDAADLSAIRTIVQDGIAPTARDVVAIGEAVRMLATDHVSKDQVDQLRAEVKGMRADMEAYQADARKTYYSREMIDRMRQESEADRAKLHAQLGTACPRDVADRLHQETVQDLAQLRSDLDKLQTTVGSFWQQTAVKAGLLASILVQLATLYHLFVTH